jgi:serine/threonine protein kinase
LVERTAVGVLKVHKADHGNPQRARREVDAMRRLTARGLTSLLAADDGEPTRWFVMQYHPRGPVAAARSAFKDKPLRVLRGALQVAEALEVVHALPLVHRDIKPSNIFLGDDGRWILGDFGIALDADQTRLTVTEVLWSRDWMPDWMTDRPLAEATPVVDLYMLVLTAYSMITGRKPRASQMDEADFDLRKLLPEHPHIGIVAKFFEEHIVNKEQNVVSRTAAELCLRLEQLISRLQDRGTLLPLCSFISSHTMTDISPSGRKFDVVVMNPRPCVRIALSVRGLGTTTGGKFKLVLDKQFRTLPLPDNPETWQTYEGFDLDTPLPEGPISVKVEPLEGVISGILIWTA